jgi:hypothetical protein
VRCGVARRVVFGKGVLRVPLTSTLFNTYVGIAATRSSHSLRYVRTSDSRAYLSCAHRILRSSAFPSRRSFVCEAFRWV